jgi:ABC-type dipeptide/oligopeptide/nickel transport system permease subunit
VMQKIRRDKITLFALGLLIFMIAVTLAAPWLVHDVLGFDPLAANLRERNQPPTWAAESWPMFREFTSSCERTGCEWALWGPIFRSSVAGLGQCFQAEKGGCHWLGTDEAGRDVLARGIYGGRISLRIGVYVASVSLTLGVLLGLISGYYATTFIDDVINAIIMTLGSIPLLFLLLILSRIFSTFSPGSLAFLLGVFGWMGLSRLVRGQIFSIREREYIREL